MVGISNGDQEIEGVPVNRKCAINMIFYKDFADVLDSWRLRKMVGHNYIGLESFFTSKDLTSQTSKYTLDPNEVYIPNPKYLKESESKLEKMWGINQERTCIILEEQNPALYNRKLIITLGDTNFQGLIIDITKFRNLNGDQNDGVSSEFFINLFIYLHPELFPANNF